MFSKAIRRLNVSLKNLDDKSKAFSYPWSKPLKETTHKYILLYSNKSPKILKWLSIVALVQFIGGSMMAWTVLDVQADMPNVMKWTFAGGLFIIGLGTLLGTHYYSRHYVLEMGLINPQTIRLVTANMGFRTREIHIDSKGIQTSTLELIKNPKKKQDYFYLELENSKFNYICDISTKHSYMDRQMMIQFFENKPMYPLENKKRGFPYK